MSNTTLMVLDILENTPENRIEIGFETYLAVRGELEAIAPYPIDFILSESGIEVIAYPDK